MVQILFEITSFAGSARFAPLSNDGQNFSAENFSASGTRLKPEVMSGPQLLNTVNMLNCIEQVSQTNPSVVANDLEYDRLLVSNVHKDHEDTSQFDSNEPVSGVDDDSQYDFMHRKSTSQSPTVAWDQKSEIMKATGLKFSDGNLRDSKLLVEEPGRNGSLDHTELSPIIADFSKSSCVKKQFEEVTEVESYVDALNTLEEEADADFDCQTKCIQTFSNKGYTKNGSGVEKMPKKYTYSSNEVPLALDSSNKCILQSDIYLNVSRTLELQRSTQEAGMSTTSAFREIDDDRHPWFNDAEVETIPNSETKPPISISSIPSITLWTNGNLLGLQPSKPPDFCPPSSAGKGTKSNSSNTSTKFDKENMAHGQRSPQLNSIGSIEDPPKALSIADQKILDINQILSRKDVVEGHNSVEHPTQLDCQYDGFCAKQNSQEQSEAITFSQHEGSQGASPNVLTARISQVHQTASAACSMEIEQYNTSNVSSPFMDSLHNIKSLSPSFPGLTRRNDVEGLQIKPSLTHSRSVSGYEPSVNDSQSKGKPLIDIHQKSLNGVVSRTFYEQKLASQTLDEQSFINKANYGVLEKSIYSGFHHFQNSSPPLEHMKISFYPMNGQGESNLTVGVHDGCISREIDGHVFSSFQLFQGCTLPAQDGGSESDDDTFCRSYPYSTEDLLSPRSDSNSDIWEQDECSISKINEVPDDLRIISSSAASISSNGGLEQINHEGQEIRLKDIFTGNDTVPFQYGGYISSIPSLESLINPVKYDSMSSSPKNASTLVPTELPPPPPLPPIHWRLLRPSYEISQDNYSNVSQLINRFEGPLNQNLCGPAENENIIRRPPPLGEDGLCKKVQDNQKLDGLLQTNLSSNPFELDRSQHLLHQIRDMDIQRKLKPCEESKSQVATGKGFEEMDDLLHQIRTKHLMIYHTVTKLEKGKRRGGDDMTHKSTSGPRRCGHRS
ncbi:SCAR-like protein 2 [Platanthera guangdongensis]|uniref:Protein SCAR n=1 Tax=Platanthera guangdongensis TaxID=2320717 RepID=A0ABR2M1T1_9ASPA